MSTNMFIRSVGPMVLTAASLMLLGGCAAKSGTAANLTDVRTAEDEAFQDGAERPPTVKTQFLYARMLAAQGHWREADTAYRAILTEHSNFAPAYLELANLRMERGQTHRAVFLLGQAIDLRPDDSVLLNNLGVCFMTLKKYNKALKSFSDAAAATPDNPRYRANLAMALGMLGRYDEALALYRQVVDPGQAHYNAALLAEAGGSVERAKAEYEQALELDDSLPRAEALEELPDP